MGIKWEMFDDQTFDMFAVRPVGDKDLNSPRLFHFVSRLDAEDFKRLAEKAHCAVPKANDMPCTCGAGFCAGQSRSKF